MTEAQKRAKQKYESSQKGKSTRQKYELTDKGKAVKSLCRKRFRTTKRDRWKMQNKKSRLKRYHEITYNLSVENIIEMLVMQDNKCAICRREIKFYQGVGEGLKDGINVDHDHKTKKVRGLLCPQCNRGIGMFYDNIEFLQEAVVYLKQYINV